MQHLYFGTRARRRERFKRHALRITLLFTAAALAGFPGADFGLRLLEVPTRALAAVAGAGEPSGGIETTESAAGMIRFRRQVFELRPTPTPSPTEAAEVAETETTTETLVAADYSGSITEIIYAAAAEYGLSGSYLLSVASCESGLDPSAYNPAGYHGLFQFDQSTWSAYGYGSIYDPTAQARTAARLIAAGQTSRWPNCA